MVAGVIERLLAAERALAAGQLDVADRLFSQVADADDRNAMAVAGRAEVALARGDTATAHELAALALAIDPEEAAAARVLATTRSADAIAIEPPAVRPGGLVAWLRRLFGRG